MMFRMGWPPARRTARRLNADLHDVVFLDAFTVVQGEIDQYVCVFAEDFLGWLEHGGFPWLMGRQKSEARIQNIKANLIRVEVLLTSEF
jgi:hypothetical protein